MVKWTSEKNTKQEEKIKELKAYLSGGIEWADDSGKNWREKLIPWLERRGIIGINPADYDKDLEYPPKEIDGKLNYGPIREIFQVTIIRDLDLVKGADLVICLWDGAAALGAGTHGELTMARYYDIPVIIWNKTNLDIPSWIVGCSTYICKSLDELKGFLACIYTSVVLENPISAEGNKNG